MSTKHTERLESKRAERSEPWNIWTLRSGVYGIAIVGAVSCGGRDVVCLDNAGSGTTSDGCGEALTNTDSGEATSDAPLDLIAADGTDLDIGSHGDEVRALHGYLTRYGYFPNDALRRAHSWWLPIVGSAPADPQIYDERTKEAVMAFQANVGLASTGKVDVTTRVVLRTPRCGVPDALPGGRTIEKWAHAGSSWGNTELTWRVVNVTGANLSVAQVTAAADVAFDAWSAETGLTFTNPSSGSVDITIGFADLADNLIGQGASPANGGDILVDNTTNLDPPGVPAQRIWTNDGTPTASQYDLRSLLLHEIGHALGLLHSSIGDNDGTPEAGIDAVMNSGLGAGQTRMNPTTGAPVLHVDDTVGIGGLYDEWEWLDGQTARDIGVGRNGAAWIVGGSSVPGGYRIYRWNGSSWSLATGGGGAVRIAVGPTGVPWIVASDGGIYRRSTSSSSSGSWQWVEGCATDIGVGGDGSVWITGCTPAAGGFAIYELVDAATGQWASANGQAYRVSVDDTGVPWVVATDGAVYRRASGSASSGSWQWVQGLLATDVAAGPVAQDDSNVLVSYVYALGATPIAGGYEVFMRNEQSAGDGEPAALLRNRWVKTNGGATSVAVGPDGDPWVTASDLAAYRRLR
jgi:peptidoglycan hydrolase-like protein with peptidoglycan-binding domain